jgi:hypothetical protein
LRAVVILPGVDVERRAAWPGSATVLPGPDASTSTAASIVERIHVRTLFTLAEPVPQTVPAAPSLPGYHGPPERERAVGELTFGNL